MTLHYDGALNLTSGDAMVLVDMDQQGIVSRVRIYEPLKDDYRTASFEEINDWHLNKFVRDWREMQQTSKEGA